MSAIEQLHGRMVHGRRVRTLARHLSLLLEEGWSVADVGCGDGRLAALCLQQRPSLDIRGFDVLVRPDAAIPVAAFDGRRLPLDDESVDAVMLIDVLHHTDDLTQLLSEATRVARQAVVIKDHRLSRPLATATLRFMDRVGNQRHGVALPYNYWAQEQWHRAWREIGWMPDCYQTSLGLYPWPANWLFEVGLHFIARLRPAHCRFRGRPCALTT